MAASTDEEALCRCRGVRDEIRAFGETLPGDLLEPDDPRAGNEGGFRA